jgi:type I site-specific restriction-modification system R (restriction) subunit
MPYDNNLTDHLSETSINHAFHHNAFLIVSNGDRARYGSITSKWEHFTEWKRNEEKDTRDDIIVISDEAQRTQAGKFARNMRLALPNASFLGFTGTPLFKYDHLTKRIFGGYVSRYDFRRSEEDNSTVKQVYENRGEKLGIARLDLNDRIAEAIARAELDPDKEALLERLLGQDYEVITAGDRLDKLAADYLKPTIWDKSPGGNQGPMSSSSWRRLCWRRCWTRRPKGARRGRQAGKKGVCMTSIYTCHGLTARLKYIYEEQNCRNRLLGSSIPAPVL